MGKISGQLLISGQFQDTCEFSGQLGALSFLCTVTAVLCTIHFKILIDWFTDRYLLSTNNYPIRDTFSSQYLGAAGSSCAT